jgi:hypothetical protein
MKYNFENNTNHTSDSYHFSDGRERSRAGVNSSQVIKEQGSL